MVSPGTRAPDPTCDSMGSWCRVLCLPDDVSSVTVPTTSSWEEVGTLARTGVHAFTEQHEPQILDHLGVAQPGVSLNVKALSIAARKVISSKPLCQMMAGTICVTRTRRNSSPPRSCPGRSQDGDRAESKLNPHGRQSVRGRCENRRPSGRPAPAVAWASLGQW